MGCEENKPVTTDGKRACMSACTRDAEIDNEKACRDLKASDFAKALALIAALPLSDIEKAEAVRRLLANKSVGS
jgi:hypothetical protein